MRMACFYLAVALCFLAAVWFDAWRRRRRARLVRRAEADAITPNEAELIMAAAFAKFDQETWTR